MIKNIIFDFGDIFINLDKEATAREMMKYGFKAITPELNTLFQRYEKGEVSTDEFLNITESLFPKASKQDLINAWNAILLDFPEYRLNFLEDLANKNTYRLFLLSNTNDLHIAHEKNNLKDRFKRFESAFERFYLSHEIGMRKPDTEIFDFVLQENGLLAYETFFIDDTEENTEAAATLGIKTWNLKVGLEDIVELENHLPC